MHLLVLYALATRHNDRDYHCAFGQLKRMALDTHLHPTTLSLLLGELEDRGYITVWEGQLPARKDDPADGRRTRGTMWCFVGLDSDDGPNIRGAEPRIRQGGRPKTELVQDKLSLADQLAGGARSVSRKREMSLPETGDEFAGSISPLTNVRTNGKTKDEANGARSRAAPDLSSTNGRATNDAPEQPSTECPECNSEVDARGRGHKKGPNPVLNCARFGDPPDKWRQRANAARAGPGPPK